MSEVKTFDELPEEVQAIGEHEAGTAAILAAYNAGLRAGRAAGGDVRVQAAIAAMQGYLASPDPQIWTAGAEPIAEWSVQNADALIAALEKEKP